VEARIDEEVGVIDEDDGRIWRKAGDDGVHFDLFLLEVDDDLSKSASLSQTYQVL
jgi:hypothetical protein